MNKIKKIYKLELLMMLSKKTGGLLLFLLIFSIIFLQDGIGKYQSLKSSIKTFQEYERSKVQQYQYLRQYGVYGVKILFSPSPLSIYFCNSSTISELTAIVDSGERLTIYNSVKGQSLFNEKAGGFKDFSGIMLIFGSAFSLFIGYQSFWHKDYIRFMTGVINQRRLFFAILFSRVLIIGLFLFIQMILSLIQFKLSGIGMGVFPYGYLLIYLGILFLVWIFFFILGTLASSFKSRFTGLVVLMITWFVLIFAIPSAINSYIYSKAESIDAANVEKKTLEMLMNAEKAIDDKIAITKTEDPIIICELLASYLDKDFPAIQDLEKKLKNKIEKNIHLFHKLSWLVPSTFYLSSNNEISSKGYASFIRFYEYIQDQRHQFVYFILTKLYGKTGVGTNHTPVEFFFKNDDDIFKAKPSLPSLFLVGIFLTIFYILCLTKLSYHLFKKSLNL